jgi:hypothetical protein
VLTCTTRHTRTLCSQVADALNGAAEAQCHNITVPVTRATTTDATSSLANTARHSAPPPADAVIVAASGGDDANPGTVDKPKATIQAAVLTARGTKSKTVLLRGGTHRERATVHITAADSGLTISSYNGEDAIVSGAVPIDTKWKRVPSTRTTSTTMDASASKR